MRGQHNRQRSFEGGDDPWKEYKNQVKKREREYFHAGESFVGRQCSHPRVLGLRRGSVQGRGRALSRTSKRAQLVAKSHAEAEKNRESARVTFAECASNMAGPSPGLRARLQYQTSSLGRVASRRQRNDSKAMREFVKAMAKGIKVYKYARNGVVSERIMWLAERSVVWAKSRKSRRQKLPLVSIQGIRQGSSSYVFRQHMAKSGSRLDPKTCASLITRPGSGFRDTLDIEFPTPNDCFWFLSGMREIGIYCQDIPTASSMRTFSSSNVRGSR